MIQAFSSTELAGVEGWSIQLGHDDDDTYTTPIRPNLKIARPKNLIGVELKEICQFPRNTACSLMFANKVANKRRALATMLKPHNHFCVCGGGGGGGLSSLGQRQDQQGSHVSVAFSPKTVPAVEGS